MGIIQQDESAKILHLTQVKIAVLDESMASMDRLPYIEQARRLEASLLVFVNPFDSDF